MISSDAGREASARLRRVGWFLHARVVETKFRALERTIKPSTLTNHARQPAIPMAASGRAGAALAGAFPVVPALCWIVVMAMRPNVFGWRRKIRESADWTSRVFRGDDRKRSKKETAL